MIEQEHVFEEEIIRARNPRMTPRDLAILRRIGEQYALRFDQVRKLLAQWSPDRARVRNDILSEEVTRRIIRRWKAEKLVSYKLFLFDEPGWLWLTRKGLQYVGLNFRYWEPKPAELQHLYYINQARAYVEERRAEDKWIAERYIRAQQENQQRGTTVEHRPDGVLVKHDDGGRIAIEVELSAKSKIRYASILRDIQPRYHRVWYFATTTVSEVLQEALSNLSEEQRRTIQILPLEERL